ncbi:hypothetical protein P691DRAFT_768379 [Macrolepiota fuliginosa MF-IS2]|uniref:Uncharacterized protein n=1 Tax=Macrolepiota fuliginosa MF-IS2 TaxID=1400762 RepID=A0A9P5WX50_9AGAR|nr:hypothetical protein P691DRAFT_768379 [Macrolepiota fuliginosa MF-IS2]
MSKHDHLPPQYYVDSKDCSLLPAYIHPNNSTIDRNLIAHGTVINTNLPSMDCSDGQFFHIHAPANLPAGDDLMHTVPAILFCKYLVYNADQLSSNPDPNRKRYPFGPPPGFQEFSVWFNSQPIKFKLLEWDFITGTFFYPSGGEMVDLNVIDLTPYADAFPPEKNDALISLNFMDSRGKILLDKILAMARSIAIGIVPPLRLTPWAIPVRDQALPGKIETSAPNTPVGLIGHITLSSLDPLAVPPSSLTLSEVVHTINPMQLMTTATPSSTTSTGIPGPANPTPQSILDQSGDDSNTNEGELIDYDNMMDDGTSRENLQNTMGGAGGDEGRVGAK